MQPADPYLAPGPEQVSPRLLQNCPTHDWVPVGKPGRKVLP